MRKISPYILGIFLFSICLNVNAVQYLGNNTLCLTSSNNTYFCSNQYQNVSLNSDSVLELKAKKYEIGIHTILDSLNFIYIIVGIIIVLIIILTIMKYFNYFS